MDNKEKKKQNAIDTAMKYLSYRDRTSQEIWKYLKNKEHSKEEIEEAIGYLENFNYIDDSAYAQRYLESASNKGKGIIKIKGELQKKGITDDIINQILSDEDVFDKNEERQRALEQAEKILKSITMDYKVCDDDDYDMKVIKYKALQKVKGKIGRRLCSLGYSQDIVYSVINYVLEDNNHI